MKFKLKKMKMKTIGTSKTMLRELIHKMRGHSTQGSPSTYAVSTDSSPQERSRYESIPKGAVGCHMQPTETANYVNNDYKVPDRFDSGTLPKMNEFRTCKLNFKQRAVAETTEAYKWIDEVDTVDDYEDLIDDGAYQVISSKIQQGLEKICFGELQRVINLDREKLDKQGTWMNGRQVTWLLYQHYRINQTDVAIMDITDVINLKLKGDNVREFMGKWDTTLLHVGKRPDDEQLEVLLPAQLETSMQLKNTLALYENDIMHGRLQRSYDELLKMVRRFLENKLLNKNRNARNEDQGGSRYGAAAFKGKRNGRGKGKGKDSKGKHPPKVITGDCKPWVYKRHVS